MISWKFIRITNRFVFHKPNLVAVVERLSKSNLLHNICFGKNKKSKYCKYITKMCYRPTQEIIRYKILYVLCEKNYRDPIEKICMNFVLEHSPYNLTMYCQRKMHPIPVGY